jgi:hypothetical protein
MKKIILFMLIISFVFSYDSNAQGNLLLTPMRLIFDGTKNTQELNLVNIGNDTATFSISFINYKMQEDGTFVKAEKSDEMQMSAEPYLRIYPQRVTLAPGEPQVIMLQYRRKSNMQPGEYHSHLYFRAEKDNTPLGMKNPKTDSTHLTINLIPVYGLCIPIIIRTGDAKVNITLSDLKLEKKPELTNWLKLTLNRSGNISTYGDIIVEYLPAKGKAIQIGAIRGIGVYTDINKRNIAIKLNNSSATPYLNGKLRIRYISNDESKKSEVLAEGELDI